MKDRTGGLYWARTYPTVVTVMSNLTRRPYPEDIFAHFAGRMRPDVTDAQIIEQAFKDSLSFEDSL